MGFFGFEMSFVLYPKSILSFPADKVGGKGKVEQNIGREIRPQSPEVIA